MNAERLRAAIDLLLEIEKGAGIQEALQRLIHPLIFWPPRRNLWAVF
jgi:hypothetical protein